MKYIYALADCRTPTRFEYIGVTGNIRERFRDHYKGQSDSTRSWIKGLQAIGFCPALTVLDSVTDESADAVEIQRINEHRPPLNRNRLLGVPTPAMPNGATLDDAERNLIVNVLKLHGNKVKAASVLGIGRQTLYNKLTKYRIEL